MDITKGIKTSEFWLSVAAFLVGCFVASGVLPSTHWGMKLAGAVLAGLGTLGYSISRGLTKGGSSTGGGTSPLVVLLVVGATALSSGCLCSTPRACLVTAQKVTALADKPALDLIGKQCLAEATKCGPVGSVNCPGWQKCDKARTAYKAAMDGIDGALATCNRVLFDLQIK